MCAQEAVLCFTRSLGDGSSIFMLTVASCSYKLCCDVWLKVYIFLLSFVFPIPQPKTSENDLVINLIIFDTSYDSHIKNVHLSFVHVFQFHLSVSCLHLPSESVWGFSSSFPLRSDNMNTGSNSLQVWVCVSECVSFEWWTVAPPRPWIGISMKCMKLSEWIDGGL